jgi:uncharacterized protein (DUF305 family)
MVLFLRTFIRNRAISLAATASVAASFALTQDTSKSYHLRGAMPVQYVADRPDLADEQPFLSDNDAAMNKMMADMVIKPSGDIDRDFVTMMLPHHQGAIEMAQAELHHGHDSRLRCLARKIVAARQREIAAMRLALGKDFPVSPGQPDAMASQDFAPGAVPRGELKMNTRLQ